MLEMNTWRFGEEKDLLKVSWRMGITAGTLMRLNTNTAVFSPT